MEKGIGRVWSVLGVRSVFTQNTRVNTPKNTTKPCCRTRPKRSKNWDLTVKHPRVNINYSLRSKLVVFHWTKSGCIYIHPLFVKWNTTNLERREYIRAIVDF